jgi:hypothetical protein
VVESGSCLETIPSHAIVPGPEGHQFDPGQAQFFFPFRIAESLHVIDHFLSRLL